MIVEAERRTSRPYWTKEVAPRQPPDMFAVVERGRDLLVDAITCRLMSDVNLGTLTSGGLDSSLTTAIAVARFPPPCGPAKIRQGGRDPR